MIRTSDSSPVIPVFLHGRESSTKGTKARWFATHFPAVRMWDFDGDLDQRLSQLEQRLQCMNDLILVGSSFGGLMAACFAARYPERCRRLVLLAPALNFCAYQPPEQPVEVPALVVIGEHDTVCPPDLVLPLARKTFSRLTEHCVDDDHMLRETFPRLDWNRLLE
ncbi:MAG: alpha/beta hydrolase [Desulfobulbus sp.]|nr:alpha/beta hydrolase [Desulfobulbus sp.]